MSFSKISILVFLLIVAITGGYVIYVKLRWHFYTREKYAFAALSASTALAILAVTTVAFTTPWDAALEALYIITGTSNEPPSSHWAEKVLVLFFVGFVIKSIQNVFHNWDGAVSVQQKKNEKLHKDQTMLGEGLGELGRLVHRKPPLEVFNPEDPKHLPSAITPPSSTLAWRDQARELVVLRWPSYTFDPDDGWHERVSCWIGENRKTGAKVGLFCTFDDPSLESLEDFVRYVRSFGTSEDRESEFMVVVQDGALEKTITVDGAEISYQTEEALLTDLVDFTDYFHEIERRVTREHLPDSELTLPDTYVQSTIRREGENEDSERLEDFLLNWLDEPGQRQIALLGEYGQGKSTGMLMFTYHIIQNLDRMPGRIPILIELRGKSPSTLQPVELLGAWASSYRIDPKALMKLLVAGRLFVIFEGFDEMAQVTDFEARLNHFRALWKFCYPKAKLIITGRPNFFLDDRELKAALGVE